MELWPQDTLAESSRVLLPVPGDVTLLDTTQGQVSNTAQTILHNKGLSQGLKRYALKRQRGHDNNFIC